MWKVQWQTIPDDLPDIAEELPHCLRLLYIPLKTQPQNRKSGCISPKFPLSNKQCVRMGHHENEHNEQGITSNHKLLSSDEQNMSGSTIVWDLHLRLWE